MTMAPKAKARDTSSDDYLDATYARGRRMIPLSSYASFENENPAGKVDPAKIRKTTSMLEFNEIRDMVQFGEDMDSLSDLSGCGAAAANDIVFDDDAGFFIDDSDHRLDAPLSTSPDGVADAAAHHCLAATEKTRSGVTAGRMRRVMSAASLSTRAHLHKLGLSSSMVKRLQQEEEIPTINEEGDATNNPKNRQNGVVVDAGGRPSRSSSENDGLVTALLPRKSCLKRASSYGSSNSNPLRSTSAYQLITESDDNDEKNHTMQRNVSFSSLEIRSYNITLGDAPTHDGGPPVSLAWEYDPAATEEHDVHKYELYRTSQGPRRSKCEMRMPPEHRKYLLLRQAGCTRREIQGTVEEARRTARQRERTARGSRLRFVTPVEEALERTRRKVFRKRW